MTEATPLHVVAAVIRRGDTVLACRRSADRSAGGRWEFPGGKIEPGETPVSALVREIREELGVIIRVVGELTSDDTPVGDRTIRLTCLDVELTGDAPTASTDHDDLRWVALSDLHALDWAEPDLPAVRKLTTPPHSR